MPFHTICARRQRFISQKRWFSSGNSTLRSCSIVLMSYELSCGTPALSLTLLRYGSPSLSSLSSRQASAYISRISAYLNLICHVSPPCDGLRFSVFSSTNLQKLNPVLLLHHEPPVSSGPFEDVMISPSVSFVPTDFTIFFQFFPLLLHLSRLIYYLRV